MTSPAPRVGPSPVSVLLLLVVAAVVGFVGGALLALTAGPRPDPGPVAARSPVAAPATTAPAAPPSVHALTLVADRQEAEVGELIRLEGQLTPAQSGVVLQVQQAVDEKDFVDFPVTVTTRTDGSYGVWVLSGLQGRNQFRLVTTVDGDSVDSPPVLVVVG